MFAREQRDDPLVRVEPARQDSAQIATPRLEYGIRPLCQSFEKLPRQPDADLTPDHGDRRARYRGRHAISP